MINAKTNYIEKKIREGYATQDVTMWHSLLREAETEIGESHKNLFLIMELANHNESSPLAIIATGRALSGEKKVNTKFMDALHNMVNEIEEVPNGDDRECGTTGTNKKKPIGKQCPGGNGQSGTVGKNKLSVYSTGILDLTADEETLSGSGSYEVSECSREHDPLCTSKCSSCGDLKRSLGFYNYIDSPNSADAYEIDGFVVPDKKPKAKRKLETIFETQEE